jgi:hypothetical protein
MIGPRKHIPQERCGWFKALLGGRERRAEKKATFRPVLESLERREVLNATGLDAAQTQVCLHYLGQVQQQAAAIQGDMNVLIGDVRHGQNGRIVPDVRQLQKDFGAAAQDFTFAANVMLSQGSASPQDAMSSSGFTPGQIRHAYRFDRIAFDNGTIVGDGSGQTIAIIESSADPTIGSDASRFNARYDLPQFNAPGGPALQVVSLRINGQTPEVDPSGNGEGETAMDVEWAHAIAPGANILLVYAPVQLNWDGSWSDSTPVYQAAQWAASRNGVSVVSMSLGGSQPGESVNDSYFTTPPGHAGVTFVASAGDHGGFIYPASSPNVLAVGGTNLTLNGSGYYGSETVWNEVDNGTPWSGGGGPDPNYSSPYYYAKQGPDVAYNAVGFSVYNNGRWIVDGGTSAGAPQWAALIAIADQGRALEGLDSLDGATQTLPLLYNMPGSAFHTDLPGSNQNGVSGQAAIGLGTPYADRVVSELSGQPISPSRVGHQPPSSQPPNPLSELAADALCLTHCFKSGNLGGVYAALMDFESILSHSPASSQFQLEQAFIDDIFADM